MFSHYVGKQVLYDAGEGIGPILGRLTVIDKQFAMIPLFEPTEPDHTLILNPISSYQWTGTRLDNGELSILIQPKAKAGHNALATV